MAESRVKKTLINARINFVFYFVMLVVSFFSRKIFLTYMGADFMGLTGTLRNLLGFLNLAELGIGVAISYVLYKPLYDRDDKSICEIISVLGYLYRWIGFIILTIGCIIACFLPLIFPFESRYNEATGECLSLGVVYFAYFAFLSSTLIGYFINYRQTLLSADQRNYVVTAYYQTMNVIRILLQMALIYYTRSFYVWLVIEFSFGILYSLVLNWRINKTYPWLKTDIRNGHALMKKYPAVLIKTKQLFIHQIGNAVQFQTRQVLIYSFVSLSTVTMYGNYTIIVDKLYLLMSNFLSGMGASVGNLIAEGNKTKIQNVFWELFSFRMFLYSTIIFSIYHLINPFIVLWLGKEYLFSKDVVTVIVAYMFIDQYRGCTYQFLIGYGLVNDIWAPLAEAAIYIVVSIVGGYFLGLIGVLLGPVVSTFVVEFLWKPYYLFKRGFEIPVYIYWINNFKYIILTAVAAVISVYILKRIGLLADMVTWKSWILNGVCTTLVFALCEAAFLYVFTNGGRMFVNRFMKFRHA